MRLIHPNGIKDAPVILRGEFAFAVLAGFQRFLITVYLYVSGILLDVQETLFRIHLLPPMILDKESKGMVY